MKDELSSLYQTLYGGGGVEGVSLCVNTKNIVGIVCGLATKKCLLKCALYFYTFLQSEVRRLGVYLLVVSLLCYLVTLHQIEVLQNVK